MRVLHCLDSVDPALGGPVEFVRQIANLAGGQNQQIEILSLDNKIDEWRGLFHAPIHCLDYGVTKYQYTSQLVPWLRSNVARFDAVVSHGIWKYHPVGVWRALRGRKTPHFVVVHGMLNPWFKATYPLKHLKKAIFWHSVIYPALRESAAVVFTSEEERRLAKETFSLAGCNQEVLPLGIESPAGKPERQREAYFSRFPELRGKRILLFLGRICEMKGCDLLIQALARLKSIDPRVHVVIAGPDNGGYESKIRGLAQQLQVVDRILWAGPLYGVLKWGALRSADAFVLPSHCEAFPIAVLESLGCSVPVLISDKVNLQREIHADAAGIVFPDNVDGAAGAIKQWLEWSDSTREQYSIAARACFARRYEIGVTINAFTNLVTRYGERAAQSGLTELKMDRRLLRCE